MSLCVVRNCFLFILSLCVSLRCKSICQVMYFQGFPRLRKHEARHMFVESMIRRTLGVKRRVVTRVFESGDGVIVELDIRRGWRLLCGKCGTLVKVRDRLPRREWHHVPLWGIPVTMLYAPVRIQCPHCGKIVVAAIPWSQRKCRLLTRLIWLLAACCKLLPRERIAQRFLEQLNVRTNRAYLLKEVFRQFWASDNKEQSRRFLTDWIWWAAHSCLKPMCGVAWTLRNHFVELLNYFEIRIDNGAVEEMNNKAKVVSHRCYGFRTSGYYILALYHCLGNLPTPKLVHKFL